MINLNSAILPGIGAAGLYIHHPLGDVMRQSALQYNIETIINRGVIYRSESVDVWTQNDIIFQIMLHGKYRGCLPHNIGIGSSLHEVRTRLGPTTLDEEDNLIVVGIEGMALEVDVDALTSPVIEIYVFVPQRG